MRAVRSMHPVIYPLMLLGCGVMIAQVAPPFVPAPIPLAPVVVRAPTKAQRQLQLRADTLARMLTRKNVDSATSVEWARDFVKYGDAAHVNPRLLVAIAYAESEFNPHALSRAGAIGLMQILPERSSWLAYEHKCGRMSPTSLRDPKVNICFGAFIYAEFLERHHGDRTVALAAYNNGTGQMSRYPSRVYASMAALR